MEFSDKIKSAIKEYQCSGCMKGDFPECYNTDNAGVGCGEHYAGSGMVGAMGHVKFFLGMPKGFNRLGDNDALRPRIFETYEQLSDEWSYNKWNIAVWKYVSPDGHTFVRGLSPRVNTSFVHVILENCVDKFDCYEVTEEDVNYMD